MARCPECRKWLWHGPGRFDEYVCPGCGAVLKRNYDLRGGLLFGSLEVVGHTRERYLEDDSRLDLSEAEVRARYNRDRGLPEAEENATSLKAAEAKWGHCNYCEAVIMLSNARFCSNCGASIRHGLKDATPLEMQEKAKPADRIGAPECGEECMVCNLELGEGDDVLWCPHCGSPAHKTHLLEWIRTRHNCPICGQRLDESEFR
jgi:hypothetical protein